MTSTVQINPNTPSLKEMPHNLEAEQGLLGAILLNNDVLFDISEYIIENNIKSINEFSTKHKNLNIIAFSEFEADFHRNFHTIHFN